MWVRLIGVSLLGLALGAPPSVASTATEDLEMVVARKAELVGQGEAARLTVTATCPVGGQLLESFVYVNQGGFSTQWGHVRVPCDGEPHVVSVLVEPLDFTLTRGKASASGYMVLTTGESISPVQKLKLK